MTFDEMIQIWEIQHPTTEFWNVMIIPETIDKNALINHLLYEYGDMETVDNDSGFFRNHIANFFQTHKWNIEKLAETLNFSYDPITDNRWAEYQKSTDDKTVDFTKDRDITTKEDFDGHEIVDDDTTSHMTDDNSNTHFVSAFNDALLTGGQISDTEQYRDVAHDVNDGIENEDIEKTTNNETNVRTDDDVVGKTTTDDDASYTKVHLGNNNHTFQELIDEERRQAEFNIYKWIGRHFRNELLIPVW